MSLEQPGMKKPGEMIFPTNANIWLNMGICKTARMGFGKLQKTVKNMLQSYVRSLTVSPWRIRHI